MFRGDTRGQSVQVGVIILLAFAVIGFSSYQAVVVPQQNQEVEFDHSRDAQRDVVDLRNSIVRAGNGEVRQSGVAQVNLGVGYPSRIFALNAPTASGRIETTGEEEIRVEDSTGSKIDVCPKPTNSEPRGHSTAVRYEPSYNYYNNAPVTYYENTFTYSDFEGEYRLRTAGRLLLDVGPGESDEPRINLIAARGDFRQSGTQPVSVDTYAGGAKAREANPGTTIRIPTTLGDGSDEDPDTDTEEEDFWAEAMGYDSVDDMEGGAIKSGSFEIYSPDGYDVAEFELAESASIYCTEVGLDETPPSGVEAITSVPGGVETALPPDTVAYNDANGNGQYDDDETTYSKNDFDNTADSGPNGDFSGKDIVVERDISVEQMSLQANSFTASGVLLESTENKELSIKTSGSGPIDISGSTVSSEKEVSINGKSVQAVNSDITAGGKFTLTSNREADLSGSNINTGNKKNRDQSRRERRGERPES